MDYYVYFKSFEDQVSTSDLKIVLNQQLEDSQGQPRLGRYMVDPHYTDFIGKLLISEFFSSQSLTNFFLFSVVANEVSAPSIEDDDVGGMPDWAIAVVVIGLGSFAFVLIFGFTVVSSNSIKRQYFS